MITELALGELTDLTIDATGIVAKRAKSSHDWKKLFVNAGKLFIDNEENADQIFDDLSEALSSQNMETFAKKMKSETGYELRTKMIDYLLEQLHKYEIPEDISQAYAVGITNTILDEICSVAPEKYDRYFLNDWRKEDSNYLEMLASKVEKMHISLTEFNNRQIKVYTSDEKDLELKRKTENPKIGVDFFEIDDDRFRRDFAAKLNDNKICVRGRFIEETAYCILNELWRIRDPRAVFVVQSEEDWERLRALPQFDNVYIPLFIADEISPIENNTNIFIYTEDIPAFSNELIDLRPRTYDTIINCLTRAGMDVNKANTLVYETHGLYVAMKKKLFSGQIQKQPSWVLGLDDKVKKTCLLLGQWTESEGDIAVVENLSELKYEQFISEIVPYTKGEDPLIHIVNHRETKSYYLASVENTWEYLQVSVSEEIWKKFVGIFNEVINEHERIFTYNQRELLFAQYSGEKHFWSANIRKGMLTTLIIKAGYEKQESCQHQLDQIVENILEHVDNDEKWKYVSDYFVELCEIAPKIIINRLFNEFECPTGLLSLFENQDSDVIFGKNHYINILFGVNQYLVQKEYAWDALTWLLKLDDRGFKYKSNRPSDAFARVFCTWHNFTAFRSFSEKIQLVKLAFKHDRNAWDIVYNSLPGRKQSIFGTNQVPKYREYLQESSVTYEELNKTAVGYIDALLNHTNYKPDRWKKLINYSEEVDDSIRNKIFEGFFNDAAQMSDIEIIEVKNSIRKLIHKHRYFSTATWAMPKEKIQLYESLLDRIHSLKPEYEYLYIFLPAHERPLLHPVSYEEDNKRESNDEALEELLSSKISEFKEKKYNLELLATLCANMENCVLGRALALYWNSESFDVKVFSTLVKTQDSAKMALEYLDGFGEQVPKLFDKAKRVMMSLGSNANAMSGLYRVEAWWSKDVPRISDASEEEKRIFWNYYYVKIEYNQDWALKECKKYGTLDSFLRLLYFANNNNPIPCEKLYDYLENIEKMQRSKNADDIQYYVEELLKPLQSAYYNEPERCSRIATLEMMFFHYLEWHDMKCFKHSISQDPKVFSDLVSVVFKTDHANKNEHTDEENLVISNLFSLYNKIEFCPGEIDGEMDEEKLKNWIDKFVVLLEENDQSSLLGMFLGHLFAFSPAGLDEYMPCEAVRTMIEQYSNDSLQREYSLTIFNRRGVYTSSAGKEEMKMANHFKENAEHLASIGCPRTAEIYFSLARSYYAESVREREAAENGRL